MYTKQEGASSIVSIFFKFKVDLNLYYPLALFSDPSILKDWMPMIQESTLLRQENFLRKSFQLIMNFPWPFSAREFLLHASGVLVKERKAVLLINRELTKEREEMLGLRVPEARENSVRAHLHKNYVYVEQEDPETTWISVLVNVDPSMSYIPDFLMNWTVKRVIYMIIGHI